jgi:sugar/nucleoside kinase (ribokinase family)
VESTQHPGVSNAIDVACFGEILWDFYEAEVKTEKEPIARQFRRELGGTSGNLAVGLARLGIKVSAVGAVGSDKLGIALEGQLAAEGVDTTHVVQIDVPTGLTFVTTNPAGEASFIPYRGADSKLSEDDVAPASAKARFAVVSSTGMLPSARPATEKFLAAVEKAKGTLVVDLNVRAHLWSDQDAMRAAVKSLVAKAHVVKASERDLGAVAGKRGMTWLDENAKHATWVLTRGENGAAAVGEHGQVTAATKRVRCIDRSGGGDAFAVGVLGVLVRAGARPGTPEWKDTKMWARALEVGHVLGAKAVAHLGGTVGLTNLDDVRGRLTASISGPAAKKI